MSVVLPYSYDNTDGHWDIGIDGYAVPKNKGQYTLKQYSLICTFRTSFLIASKVPSWLAAILPKGILLSLLRAKIL